MTRLFLSLPLILLSAAIVCAQSFTLSVTPNQQTSSGSPVTYKISAQPSGGFSASVFLSATCPTLPSATLSLSTIIINYPYTDSAELTVSLTGPKTGGVHDIYIVGNNGPVTVTDTASIQIPLKNAWHVYNTSNSNIPSNTVPVIALDDSGNGWMLTTFGVTRFDGTTWTVFDTAAGFGNNEFSVDITVDASNNVWVARTRSLSKYSNGSWTHYIAYGDTIGIIRLSLDSGITRADTGNWAGIYKIAADSKGTIWVATSDGLYSFDGTTTHHYTPQNSNIPSSDIQHVAVDGDGSVWIEGGRRVSKFDGKFWTTYPQDLGGSQLSQLYTDPQGSIWAVMNNGLMHYDNSGSHWYPSLSSNNMYLDSSAIKSHDIPFPGVAPSAMVIDVAGDTLVGEAFISDIDSTQGLAKYVGFWNDLYNISNSGLPDNNVFVLKATKDMKIWVGTAKGGLAIYDAILSGYSRPATGEGTNWDAMSIRAQVGASVGGTVVVTGLGPGALKVTGFKVTGADSSEFSIDYPNSSPFAVDPSKSSWSLRQGKQEQMSVRFNPTSLGVKSAQLVMFTSSLPEGNVVANLAGTGVSPSGVGDDAALRTPTALSLVAYPSPASTHVSMQFTDAEAAVSQPARLMFQDVLGRTQQEIVTTLDATGRATVSLAGLRLQPGVWFVRAEAGGKVAVARVVVIQ